MTRVVVDTNVLVSAAINEHGPPAAILSFIASGHLLWCVSAPILAEYRDVLARPKFSHVQLSRVQALLAAVEQAALFVPTTTRDISDDEPDNRFLECAEVAEADYLITGNTADFPAQWKKTKIVTPRQLLQHLASA
jgi:uncharacterized protein